MELREYLFRNRISITDFSKKVDFSRNYISQIALGYRKPSKKLAKLIEKETNGEVTLEELIRKQEK